MKIIIYNKDSYSKSFIEKYLPSYIMSIFKRSYSKKKLEELDKEFNIDSLNIIKTALKNLKISEQTNSYSIEINKNVKYKHQNIDSLINLITYGNRSCKGYLIIYKIFKEIAENIDIIYEEWLKWQ